LRNSAEQSPKLSVSDHVFLARIGMAAQL